MKKIFSISMLIVFVVFSAVPALSKCAKKAEEVMTGAACSISELNSMVRDQSIQVKNKKPERNLRPVRSHIYIQNVDENNCLFGNCLSKQIFRK